MRAVRPRGRPVVIELAGLPGAGKTTLVDAVTLPHRGRRDVSVLNLPLRRETWQVFCAALSLAHSVRPRKPYNYVRALKLTLALRCYGPLADDLVIMDQGLVQKLWSMVIETEAYSEDRLGDLVHALTPFAADHLMWIGTPHEVAARRIAARTGGNSRFDGLEAPGIASRLAALEAVYDKVIALFQRRCGLPLTRLDGEAEPTVNARILEALVAPDIQTGGRTP